MDARGRKSEYQAHRREFEQEITRRLANDVMNAIGRLSSMRSDFTAVVRPVEWGGIEGGLAAEVRVTLHRGGRSTTLCCYPRPGIPSGVIEDGIAKVLAHMERAIDDPSVEPLRCVFYPEES